MDAANLKQKVSCSKALVIGAGGIGCELLKNLALTGFKNITVIDLDTIDISNLNRQFLFRREHVGKSKAEIASMTIKQMVPDADITYYHDSVMSDEFGLDFFKQFTLVMNALDNKSARSHVNRLCLVADVPLIESGSSGYLGQVSVILKSKTECFDCVPKAAQKTYPACTIRNTPTEFIHCVIWAKSLFNQLFGEENPDEDVAPDVSDENDNGGNKNDNAFHLINPSSVQNDDLQTVMNGNQKHDNLHDFSTFPDTQNGLLHRLSTRQFAEKNSYDPKLIFDKLFNIDINYLLLMEHLWKERKSPSPKKFAELIAQVSQEGSRKLTLTDVWSIYRWTGIFEATIKELYSRFNEAKTNKVLIWDKDDDVIMKFVAACANIRAEIFHIRGKPLFEIKAMAGNIIPAIATTNACVAGMILVEALKIVAGQLDRCKRVFINRLPNPRGKILMDEKLYPPNPSCYVCSDKREVVVRVNIEKMEAGKLRDNVLIGALHMLQPDVMELSTNRIIISSEEGETDAIMNQKIGKLGIKNGSQLECDDFKQKLNFKLLLMHKKELDLDEFELVSEEPEKNSNCNNEEKNSNGNYCNLDTKAEESSTAAKKLKLDQMQINSISTM